MLAALAAALLGTASGFAPGPQGSDGWRKHSRTKKNGVTALQAAALARLIEVDEDLDAQRLRRRLAAAGDKLAEVSRSLARVAQRPEPQDSWELLQISDLDDLRASDLEKASANLGRIVYKLGEELYGSVDADPSGASPPLRLEADHLRAFREKLRMAAAGPAAKAMLACADAAFKDDDHDADT